MRSVELLVFQLLQGYRQRGDPGHVHHRHWLPVTERIPIQIPRPGRADPSIPDQL